MQSPQTTPGQSINNENEALLASTTDDYGTSYYFRGNVQNNYLIFAGKCWRIVRITGNGSGTGSNAIKIVLQNNNGTDCSVFNSAGESAFNYAPGINSSASGIGFMYGNPTGGSYNTAQANTYDSIILSFLKGWYEDIFSDNQKSQLADVIWCNDKKVVEGNGYGSTNSYFAGTRRAWQKSEAVTLICPNAGSDNKFSKFTASDTVYGNGALDGYKIGLLTADEVAFAGATYGTNNNSYYLNNKQPYWTMTPVNIYNSDVAIYFIGTTGQFGLHSAFTKHGVRPSVALLSTTKYSLNNPNATPGTVNNPYIVN